MTTNSFGGRVAVVTGAAGGIGAAVVRALQTAGCLVAAFDRGAVALKALGGPADRLYPRVVDVRHAGEVDVAVAAVEREVGPIAFAVSVAGVLSTEKVVDTSDEAFADVFDVNVRGVFNLSRAVARHMIPRRRGAIVTVSSNAASVPRHGMATYAASKAAATMFTRCLGLELAEFGIRCNIVAPGSTRTPMQEAMWSAGSSEQAVIAGSLETYRPGIPLRRIAEPEDVAAAVVFLLSDEARHITMTDLYVDGGATLRG
jgi:2,3-dihydro-2,3-dihydroxybenzoate dehydrogenase